MANINEQDMARGRFWVGEVGLGDTVPESGSSCLVDETEDVQVGDGRGVKDSTPLNIGVPAGNRDDDVVDGVLEFGSSSVANLGEICANELSSGETLLLSEVLDLKACVRYRPLYFPSRRFWQEMDGQSGGLRIRCVAWSKRRVDVCQRSVLASTRLPAMPHHLARIFV